MTWKDITVFQWQQLMALYVGEDDREDLETATLSIVFNKTENEILSLTESERVKLLKQIDFIHTPPTGKPVKVIKCQNGKRYKCVYDVRNIRAARYIETKHFAKDPENNIHRVAASMVEPLVKHLIIGYKVSTYDATKHEEYANDLLTAPITDVLGSVVFFCEVYRRWMGNSKDYLKREMKMKGMMEDQAEEVYQTLWSITDGITKQLWWRNTNASS